jgi:hypothetical protein
MVDELASPPDQGTSIKLDTLKGPVSGLLTYLGGFIEECGDSEKRSMEIVYC